MIGDRVKTYRLAWGYTQRELADLVNTRGYRWTPSTVSKVETNVRPLEIHEAAVLTTILNVTLDDLLS